MDERSNKKESFNSHQRSLFFGPEFKPFKPQEWPASYFSLQYQIVLNTKIKREGSENQEVAKIVNRFSQLLP